MFHHYPCVKIFCNENAYVQLLLFQISEYILILKFLHSQQDNFNDVIDAALTLLNLNTNI